MTKKINYFLFLLMVCTLLVTPIYPDEQAFQLISFRGSHDGDNYNNLSYICNSYFIEIPSYLKPIRSILHYLFGIFSSPIAIRFISGLVFLLIYFIYRNYIYNNTTLTGILFVGYIPFSLFILRPEGISLLLIGCLILLNRNSFKIKNFVVAILFCFLLLLHPRNIFLMPFVLLIIIYENKRKSNIFNYLLLILLFFITVDIAQLYNNSFKCSEYDGINNIYKSLRPFEIGRESINNLREIFVNQIKTFPVIFKYLTITSIYGVNFLPSILENKPLYMLYEGYTKITFLIILVIILYENVKKLKKLAIDRESAIDWSLILFLFSCLFFQKIDRFYEGAIFFPILILLFNNIALLQELKYNFIFVNLKIITYFSIITIVIVILPRFVQGYGPYTPIKERNQNIIEIVNSLNLNNINKKFLVVDFDTFHYLKESYRPILMNFFWWYTDEIFSENKDLNKLRLLKKLESDGIFMMCDRMPNDLQKLSRKINVGGKIICYIDSSTILEF